MADDRLGNVRMKRHMSRWTVAGSVALVALATATGYWVGTKPLGVDGVRWTLLLIAGVSSASMLILKELQRGRRQRVNSLRWRANVSLQDLQAAVPGWDRLRRALTFKGRREAGLRLPVRPPDNRFSVATRIRRVAAQSSWIATAALILFGILAPWTELLPPYTGTLQANNAVALFTALLGGEATIFAIAVAATGLVITSVSDAMDRSYLLERFRAQGFDVFLYFGVAVLAYSAYNSAVVASHDVSIGPVKHMVVLFALMIGLIGLLIRNVVRVSGESPRDRIADLLRDMGAVVWESRLAVASQETLKDWAGELAITLARPGLGIKVKRGGYVHDMRLDTLQRAIDRARQLDQDCHLALDSPWIGRYLNSWTPILGSEGAPTGPMFEDRDLERFVARAFVLRKSGPLARFERSINAIRDRAALAAQTNRPDDFEASIEALEQLYRSFLVRWRARPGWASKSSVPGLHLRDALHELCDDALQTSSHTVFVSYLSLPQRLLRVGRGPGQLGAVAIMAPWILATQRAFSRGAEGDRMRQALLQRLRLYLNELCEVVVSYGDESAAEIAALHFTLGWIARYLFVSELTQLFDMTRMLDDCISSTSVVHDERHTVGLHVAARLQQIAANGGGDDVATLFVDVAGSLDDVASLQADWQAYSEDLTDDSFEWYELWSNLTRQEEIDQLYSPPGIDVPTSGRPPAAPELLGILAAYLSARTAKDGQPMLMWTPQERQWLRRQLEGAALTDADRTLWERIAPPLHMTLDNMVKMLREGTPASSAGSVSPRDQADKL